MKRRGRVIVGAVAAIATFASLSVLTHRHHRMGMWHRNHCHEQCMEHQHSEKNATPVAPPPAPDTAR